MKIVQVLLEMRPRSKQRCFETACCILLQGSTWSHFVLRGNWHLATVDGRLLVASQEARNGSESSDRLTYWLISIPSIVVANAEYTKHLLHTRFHEQRHDISFQGLAMSYVKGITTYRSTLQWPSHYGNLRRNVSRSSHRQPEYLKDSRFFQPCC